MPSSSVKHLPLNGKEILLLPVPGIQTNTISTHELQRRGQLWSAKCWCTWGHDTSQAWSVRLVPTQEHSGCQSLQQTCCERTRISLVQAKMLYYSIVSFNLSDKFGCFACFFQRCIDFIFTYIEFYVYLCVSNAYNFLLSFKTVN